MKDIGEIIKCTAKEYSNGQMEEYTKGTMYKIKSTDLAEFSGQTEKYMKVNGNKECSMDKANIKEEMGYGDKAIGKMVKEFDELF